MPAAGYGERMGGVTPKQYLNLAGQSMLQRTLSRLLGVPDLHGIVVALAPDDEHWSEVPASNDPLIHTTSGGQTRADSVISGLQYVLSNAPDTTWVMVHDAARPLVSLSDIQRLYNAVYNSGAIGGILATPVHDTLKKADEYYCIEQTVSRQSLWQAQTPQLFRAGELLHALSQAMLPPMARDTNESELATSVGDSAVVHEHNMLRAEKGNDREVRGPGGHAREIPITDEASAMERLGHEPLLVEALEPNFKITRPGDLLIAAAIIETSLGTS